MDVWDTDLQCGSDSDHQFKPGRETLDGFAQEGNNGFSIIRFMELRLIQPVNQDDEVLLTRDLPLCKHCMCSILHICQHMHAQIKSAHEYTFAHLDAGCPEVPAGPCGKH